MHSSSVTPSQAGSQFVQQYYQVLQHQQELAHLFYTGSSTMVRVDGESTQTASAPSQIQKLVESSHLIEIETKTINCVESSSEGIVVVVSGSVKSNCFTGWREFVQTLSLAPIEKKGYMVMNDIFYFVTLKDLSVKDPDTRKSTRPNKRKQNRFRESRRNTFSPYHPMNRDRSLKSSMKDPIPLVITATLPGHRVGLRVRRERKVHWR